MRSGERSGGGCRLQGVVTVCKDLCYVTPVQSLSLKTGFPMTFQSAADPAGPWQDVLTPDQYEYLPQPDGTLTISTHAGLSERAFYRAKFSTKP